MNKTAIAIVAIVVVLGAAAFQFGRVDAGERIASAAQQAAPAQAPAAESGMLRGKVVETMNTAGYTYALVDTGSAQLWLAGPETAVAVGDVVEAPPGFPMQNYHSKSLGRDFDVVYFVSGIRNTSAPAPAAAAADAGAMPPGHPPTGTGAAAQPAPISIDVAPLEAGHDIAYLFANRQDLAGKSLSLRGKVVKFNADIMGHNWIHLQDGSGTPAEGNNDLTVTTDASANVGDTVVVSGVLVLDKDFGAGYRYPVMLEQATVTGE